MRAGWENKQLSNAVTLVMGQAPAGTDCNRDGNGTPFVKVGEFGEQRPIVREWTTDPRKMARSTDVLICVVGATCGKINLGADCAIGRSVAAIRPKPDKIDQRYLWYFMQGKVQEMRQGSQGAAQTVINREMINGLQIPLPPLEEQRRIVAVLDKAFTGIAAARANTQRNLANARSLFESYLSTIFIQRDGTWEIGELQEIGGKVSTGPFGSLLHKADYVENGTPLINPAHIMGERIEPDYRKSLSPETLARLSSYVLAENDIVIGRRGEIGRCAVVTAAESGWLCGTGSFFIRPKKSANPHFLAHMLRSKPYRDALEAAATGATMLNLSNTALCELRIALPSVSRQKEFLLKLDVISKLVGKLQEQSTAKIAALSELKQSLLQKAFAGELT